MKVACVRDDVGNRAWVDCGDRNIESLDRVRVTVPTGEFEAIVLVTPEQLVSGTVPCTGIFLDIVTQVHGSHDEALPGENYPVLGSRHTVSGIEGTVTGIDPLAGTVTLIGAFGETVTVGLEATSDAIDH